MMLTTGISGRKRWLRLKRIWFVPVAALLVVILIAGVTLAWLEAQSEPLLNTFGTAEITCTVVETFSDGTKSDVSIRNTGTMDAYIRVALIPVWKDGSQIAGLPASLNDCTMEWSGGYGSVWVVGTDGYYYCKQPVPAGACTPLLIDKCTASPHGNYLFELQISAQAVQALPSTAVTSAWDSGVSAVKTDGTLEVEA
jgi:hypothetical protein